MFFKVPQNGESAPPMGHIRQWDGAQSPRTKDSGVFSELHLFLLKINKTKNLKKSIYLKQYFICTPQSIENKK